VNSNWCQVKKRPSAAKHISFFCLHFNNFIKSSSYTIVNWGGSFLSRPENGDIIHTLSASKGLFNALSLDIRIYTPFKLCVLPVFILDLTFQNMLVTWRTNRFTFNNCTLCPHCIYVFCIYLRTNSDLCHSITWLVFYNRDEKCLLRGTNLAFKQNSLRFVLKDLRQVRIWYIMSYFHSSGTFILSLFLNINSISIYRCRQA
jgi:hypothetical protein